MVTDFLKFRSPPLIIQTLGRLVRKYTNTNQEYPLASAKQLKFPHRDSELQAIMEVNDPASYTQMVFTNL